MGEFKVGVGACKWLVVIDGQACRLCLGRPCLGRLCFSALDCGWCLGPIGFVQPLVVDGVWAMWGLFSHLHQCVIGQPAAYQRSSSP